MLPLGANIGCVRAAVVLIRLPAVLEGTVVVIFGRGAPREVVPAPFRMNMSIGSCLSFPRIPTLPICTLPASCPPRGDEGRD